MLRRALQTQHPGSLVIGLDGHLTRTCDHRPLATRGWGFPYIIKGGRLRGVELLSFGGSVLLSV